MRVHRAFKFLKTTQKIWRITRISPFDLMITRQLSKKPGEYSSKRQLQVNAALKLENEGLELQAGQSISYVITRYESKGTGQVVPARIRK